jgi:hypothetical protein
VLSKEKYASYSIAKILRATILQASYIFPYIPYIRYGVTLETSDTVLLATFNYCLILSESSGL